MSRNLKLIFGSVVLGIGLVAIVQGNLIEREAFAKHGAASQQPHNGVRRLLAKGVEDDLLRMGFDVQVTFIEEDDSKLIVYGKSVNRPFAHNLMARRDFRKLLRDGKFTEVTFMDSMTFPDFSQAYDVSAVSK